MTARASVPQHLLNPETLAGLANLELVARAVVTGFLTGLHRSPFFGFSQEFAEYRAYTQGDDLRHVDWNVFARTERCYLKRYRGETNTQLLILLDTSVPSAAELKKYEQDEEIKRAAEARGISTHFVRRAGSKVKGFMRRMFGSEHPAPTDTSNPVPTQTVLGSFGSRATVETYGVLIFAVASATRPPPLSMRIRPWENDPTQAVPSARAAMPETSTIIAPGSSTCS